MRIIAFAGIGLLLWAALIGLAVGVGKWLAPDAPGEDFSSIIILVSLEWGAIAGFVVFILSVIIGLIVEIVVWREKVAEKAEASLHSVKLKNTASFPKVPGDD
jgi:hypothetical protein